MVNSIKNCKFYLNILIPLADLLEGLTGHGRKSHVVANVLLNLLKVLLGNESYNAVSFNFDLLMLIVLMREGGENRLY